MSLEGPDPKQPFKMPRIKVPHLVIIAVSAIAIGFAVYFYLQYRDAQSRLVNPTQYAADEAKRLVAMVSKLMTLPMDETPTVATVNDKEKLKNQPFFANAENGDKVLIYTNAKKAVLYRPDLNKIIDVAPVNIGPSASASATPAGAALGMKFTILNGTGIVGLTKKYETELKAKIPTADVIAKDNAKAKTYEKTILVDVVGTNTQQANQYAAVLGIEQAKLPTGEATPSGDFLIILGADKK